MYDKDSRKYSVALVTGLNGSLEGAIAAHDKLRGETAFEVPIAGAPYKVRFSQPFGADFGEWVAAPAQ
jgi:hypothetical protein